MPHARLPHAVLLDMDGTLVDTEPLWWRAVVETGAEHGRPVLEADRPFVLGQAVEHTADYLAAGSSVTARDLDAPLEHRFLRLVRDQLEVLPGTAGLLALLQAHEVPVALVSASPRSVVDTVLSVLGTELFRCSVAAGETARTKPHPDPYLAAAALLGVEPSACVAVEDSRPGVAAAEAASTRVVLAPAADPELDRADRVRVASLCDVDLSFLAGLMTRTTSPALSSTRGT